MNRSSHTLLYIQWSSFIVALFMTVTIMTSCNESRTYSHYNTVDVDGWQRGDTIKFPISSQHEGTYELLLALRATDAYPFTHITLIMEQQQYKATVLKSIKKKAVLGKRYNLIGIRKDTIRCQINDNNGTLLGKAGISSTELNYVIRKLRLHEADSLVIKLNHCMERESLAGISDIGIEIRGENSTF
ncbi:MAG: gliding motility lipoprotein GldH [Prevotella sp.]|nr:gliding motility lipoprotein GldH [Prevotella sp.]